MKKPETASISPSNPKLPKHGGSDKRAFRLSGNTTMRDREPTSERAHKFTSMVWDYSKQQPVWPNGNNKVLVEATQTTGAGLQNYAPMNRATGKPYALGTINVGGSPDAKNTTFEPSPRRTMLKG